MVSYRVYFSECPFKRIEKYFSGHREIIEKTKDYYEGGEKKLDEIKEYDCRCTGHLDIDGIRFGINLSKVNESERPFLPLKAQKAYCSGLIGGNEGQIEKLMEILKPMEIEEDG